jgi:hypothetical protein
MLAGREGKRTDRLADLRTFDLDSVYTMYVITIQYLPTYWIYIDEMR